MCGTAGKEYRMGSGSAWIAGSYQSDFARNYAREGLEISDMVAEAVTGTLDRAGLEPEDMQAIHVGNAFGQLFTGQGQLGAMPATVEPRLWGKDAKFMWPYMFSQLADEYDRRYGLAGDDTDNPVVEGRLRRTDCAQVTDGVAGLLLVSDRLRAGRRSKARIAGWGHRTAGLTLQPKLDRSRGERYVFPHVRQAVTDAFERAGLPGVSALDAIETHDCFSMSEYMAIDHFGITEPGESWKAVENGELERDGAIPVNPSGGLIGVGHPVGATGVRMLHDAARQVTGQAGECRVEGARTVATLNIGGSLATSVSFVVTRED
jgi:acetyl-CoA C-acetyltransferase